MTNKAGRPTSTPQSLTHKELVYFMCRYAAFKQASLAHRVRPPEGFYFIGNAVSYKIKYRKSYKSRLPVFFTTGDERIELPLRVLETPVIPFDQSPMYFCDVKRSLDIYITIGRFLSTEN